jgi:hypothetical protein
LREKEGLEIDVQDLLLQQGQLIEQRAESETKIKQLEQQLQDSHISGETALQALIQTCVKTSESIAARSFAENETPGAKGTSTYFIMLAEELQDSLAKLKITHENYIKNNSHHAESFLRKVLLGGHLLVSVHEQGLKICNKSANINTGESKFIYFEN